MLANSSNKLEMNVAGARKKAGNPKKKGLEDNQTSNAVKKSATKKPKSCSSCSRRALLKTVLPKSSAVNEEYSAEALNLTSALLAFFTTPALQGTGSQCRPDRCMKALDVSSLQDLRKCISQMEDMELDGLHCSLIAAQRHATDNIVGQTTRLLALSPIPQFDKMTEDGVGSTSRALSAAETKHYSNLITRSVAVPLWQGVTAGLQLLLAFTQSELLQRQASRILQRITESRTTLKRIDSSTTCSSATQGTLKAVAAAGPVVLFEHILNQAISEVMTDTTAPGVADGTTRKLSGVSIPAERRAQSGCEGVASTRKRKLAVRRRRGSSYSSLSSTPSTTSDDRVSDSETRSHDKPLHPRAKSLRTHPPKKNAGKKYDSMLLCDLLNSPTNEK